MFKIIQIICSFCVPRKWEKKTISTKKGVFRESGNIAINRFQTNSSELKFNDCIFVYPSSFLGTRWWHVEYSIFENLEFEIFCQLM